MKPSRIVSFLALALCGALAAPAAADTTPETLKLYKSQCSTCHGLDGKGQTTVGKKNGVKDWTDGKTLKAMTDDQVRQLLRTGNKGKDGKQKMPPFKKLTDAQVDALLKYVRSFDHK